MRPPVKSKGSKSSYRPLNMHLAIFAFSLLLLTQGALCSKTPSNDEYSHPNPTLSHYETEKSRAASSYEICSTFIKEFSKSTHICKGQAEIYRIITVIIDEPGAYSFNAAFMGHEVDLRSLSSATVFVLEKGICERLEKLKVRCLSKFSYHRIRYVVELLLMYAMECPDDPIIIDAGRVEEYKYVKTCCPNAEAKYQEKFKSVKKNANVNLSPPQSVTPLDTVLTTATESQTAGYNDHDSWSFSRFSIRIPYYYTANDRLPSVHTITTYQYGRPSDDIQLECPCFLDLLKSINQDEWMI